MASKLVLVEGIPGSGKTTTAEFIRDWLAPRSAQPALFLEGNLDHPADFESVACLDEPQYTCLLEQFPDQRDFLDAQSSVREGERFISYRKLLLEFGERLPYGLVQALAQYEVYELPVEKYYRLLLERWQAFAGRAAESVEVYIFECCFLQNPLTLYLGRHDAPLAAAQGHILEIANLLRPLEPMLIYLHPGEAGETLRRVAQVRPQEWLDFVIAYHTQQGHGKAQGWQGFDGMLRFYEMRQAIELELLPRLPFDSLLVTHTDWEQDHNLIAAYLETRF